jgi:hypothetical protein
VLELTELDESKSPFIIKFHLRLCAILWIALAHFEAERAMPRPIVAGWIKCPWGLVPPSGLFSVPVAIVHSPAPPYLLRQVSCSRRYVSSMFNGEGITLAANSHPPAAASPLVAGSSCQGEAGRVAATSCQRVASSQQVAAHGLVVART